MRRARAAIAVLVAACALAGCLESRYAVQAGLGQAELFAAGRPIDEVLADRRTDPRTRYLLRESRHVLAFASEQGLGDRGNYDHYVELDRGAVVWFLAACEALSFEAVTWSFPIAGSFPYLGWFDRREARRIRDRLRARGYDVYLRRVHAYSTGGYFDDPLLSTMLSEGEDAVRSLVNVILHELVHANLFVPDQSTFNESLASFVGDEMTVDYLTWRFGPASHELAAFRAELEEQRRRGAVLAGAYRALEAVYASDAAPDRKLRRKREILGELERSLDLAVLPNNALLIGFRTYNTGQAELAALLDACERRWPVFLEVVASLSGDEFGEEQREDIGPLIAALGDRCLARR